jgi:hypothetical protein
MLSLFDVFLTPRTALAIGLMAFANAWAVDASQISISNNLVRFPIPPPFSQTQPRPVDGKLSLLDLGRNTPKTTITLTDASGKDIANVIGWPKDVPWVLDHSAGDGIFFFRASVAIPAKVQKEGTGVPGVPPAFIDVADYRTSGTNAGGGTFGLNVESIFQNPLTGTFFVGNVFGTIASQVGFVSLPEFGADTNLDGSIGDGDVLFELVNLNVDLNGLPSFGIGDFLVATDGLVDGFTGLYLSSTPFVFDSVLGFEGTPYSGSVVIVGQQDLGAIPEPDAWILLLSGLAGVVALRRQQRAPKR